MAQTPTSICPSCGVGDPEIVVVDFGIGAYEFWGAPGFHTDEHLLTRCCEDVPQQFWVEPNDNLVPEDQVLEPAL